LSPHLLVIWLCGFAAINGVRQSAPHTEDQVEDATVFIKSVSGPEDELFIWAAPAQIAFESDRRFASRFPFNNYLTGRIFGTDRVLTGATRAGSQPLESAEAWRLLDRDLAAAPPALIVDGAPPGFEIRSYPLLRDYLRRFYGPATRVGSFDIYLRLARAP
jgi:hypothetical protein